MSELTTGIPFCETRSMRLKDIVRMFYATVIEKLSTNAMQYLIGEYWKASVGKFAALLMDVPIRSC